MKRTDTIIVIITASNEKEAHNIADSLLKKKKAACVNILPGVNSLFRWEGKIESTQESVLLVKTKASLFCELEEVVKKTRSYEVPEIIALPIIAGSEDYLRWLDTTCS